MAALFIRLAIHLFPRRSIEIGKMLYGEGSPRYTRMIRYAFVQAVMDSFPRIGENPEFRAHVWDKGQFIDDLRVVTNR